MSSESSVKLIENWRERWEPEFNLRGILFKVVAVFDNGEGKTFIAYKRLDGVIDTLNGSIYLIPKPRPKTYRPWKREEVPVDEWLRNNSSNNIFRIEGIGSNGNVFIAGGWCSLNDMFTKWRIHRTTESGEWLPVEQCPKCGVEE